MTTYIYSAGCIENRGRIQNSNSLYQNINRHHLKLTARKIHSNVNGQQPGRPIISINI